MTALLYTWNLARIGMGNDFYAAAVKSGTESWKAFFFGSLDPGSFITVDKPPAALWVMELSGRIFGFSSWSMLLPEALAGVATVMVLYHLVRRWFGEPAAVFASLALALTPVAVVIFRYNDPDAFLTLLLVLAAWGCWRAIETGKTIGLVLAGGLVGLAFLTKTLDAFIVVPALGLAYLWCGPPRLARRIGQLGWAALALLVSSGWWVAIVELWPKSARPYIGGSTNNSELNLIFGYNGFARIFGSGGAGAGGGTTSGSSSAFGGGEGLLRMFDNELGGQISWLLPLALIGLVAGLWLTRRSARADGRRAGFVLWGGTLVMFLAVYDYAKGIFHPYYAVVMAPAIAALAGAGVVALWRLGRRSLRWAWVLPATIVGTVLWADALLARTSGYDTWLGPTVVVTGVISALILLLCMVRPKDTRWFALFAGTVAAASVLAGPAAYSLTTLGTTTSAIATAGPASGSSGLGAGAGPGGGARPGGGAGPGGGATPGGSATVGPPGGDTGRREREDCIRACRRTGCRRAGWRWRWRCDGQRVVGEVPRKAPGLRHLPRRGQRLAVGRALHPRERQGRDRHGRLRRQRPRADAERVQAHGGHRRGAVRVRLRRDGLGRCGWVRLRRRRRHCARWLAHHGQREEHGDHEDLRHAERKVGRPGGAQGCVRWWPTGEHRQRGRCLGREVRDQGLVQRLRRQFVGRDSLLRQ